MLAKQKTPYVLATFDLLGLTLALDWAGRLLVETAVKPATLFMVFLYSITLVTLYVLEAYIPDRRNRGARMVLKTGLGVVLSAGVIVITADAAYTLGLTQPLPRGIVVLTLGLFLPWSIVVRLLLVFLTFRKGDSELWGIIGKADWVTELQKAAGREKELRYLGEISGIGNPEADESRTFKEIRNMIAGGGFSGLVIATHEPVPRKLTDFLAAFKNRDGLQVCDIVDFYEKHLYKVPVLPAVDNHVSALQNLSPPIQRIQIRLKRVIDVLLSVVLLVLTSPLLLIVSLLIKIDSHGPVVYRQVRVGIRGDTFELYKFRTMVDGAEREGPVWSDEGDTRITRVGKYLRVTRVDELPQIWNVIVNDMSLVGPRAERPTFVQWLSKEIPYYDQRHLVKPGITGWAQVMYKYGSTLEDARRKLEYDLFYIKYFSLMLDALIFLRTVRVMLFIRGR